MAKANHSEEEKLIEMCKKLFKQSEVFLFKRIHITISMYKQWSKELAMHRKRIELHHENVNQLSLKPGTLIVTEPRQFHVNKSLHFVTYFENEIYSIILNRIDQILRGIKISFDVKCAVEQVLINGNGNENENENSNEKSNNGSNNTSNAKQTMVSEDFFSLLCRMLFFAWMLYGCYKQESNENKTETNVEMMKMMARKQNQKGKYWQS